MGQLNSRAQIGRASVSLTAALATTPEIGFEEFGFGAVCIPVGSTIGLLVFYAASRMSDNSQTGGTVAPTFYQLKTALGANVQLAVAAGNAYALPAECQGVGALKIVADNAGTVELSLKS